MYVGVRAGGGIGDEIEDPAGDEYELYRVVFDITFFFFVIVILLAIIQGQHWWCGCGCTQCPEAGVSFTAKRGLDSCPSSASPYHETSAEWPLWASALSSAKMEVF